MAVTDQHYDVYDMAGNVIMRKVSLERAARRIQASMDVIAWDIGEVGRYFVRGYIVVPHDGIPNRV